MSAQSYRRHTDVTLYEASRFIWFKPEYCPGTFLDGMVQRVLQGTAFLIIVEHSLSIDGVFGRLSLFLLCNLLFVVLVHDPIVFLLRCLSLFNQLPGELFVSSSIQMIGVKSTFSQVVLESSFSFLHIRCSTLLSKRGALLF